MNEIILYGEAIFVLGVLSVYGTIKLIESLTIYSEKEVKNDKK